VVQAIRLTAVFSALSAKASSTSRGNAPIPAIFKVYIFTSLRTIGEPKLGDKKYPRGNRGSCGDQKPAGQQGSARDKHSNRYENF
jgi:hypothetical protein